MGYEVLASFCGLVRSHLADLATPSTGQGSQPPVHSQFLLSFPWLPPAGPGSWFLNFSSPSLFKLQHLLTSGYGWLTSAGHQPSSSGCFLARLWAGSVAVTPTGPAAAWEVLGFVYKWRYSQLSPAQSWSVPTTCQLFQPLKLWGRRMSGWERVNWWKQFCTPTPDFEILCSPPYILKGN